MTGPWTRNDNGLHHFDRETARCRVCGVALLDAAGLCPGPSGDKAVSPVAAPAPAAGPVPPGTTGPAQSGQPGATGGAPWPDTNLRVALHADSPCRIRCISWALTPPGAPDPHAGKWLRASDPEANDGRGWSAWCRDLASAALFVDLWTAWRCWQAVPCGRPEAGGQPNRPLTAFTVEFVADR